jgi:allatostatin receptor
VAPYVPYVIGSLYTIVCLLGLLGNSFVVTVLIANQQMRSTTNVLILNLAIADLLFILLCVPFTGNYHYYFFLLCNQF